MSILGYIGSSLIFIVGIVIFLTGGGGLYGIQLKPEQGLIFCIVGTFLFWAKYKTDKLNKENKKNLVICEKCSKKYKTKYVEIPVCPKCNGKLVEYKEMINNDTDI